PFHMEKTPSFMVNPRKGIFHCFGCGVGGDAFGFLMRQDKLSFPEAVRALAKQAGVALPEDRGGDGGERGREELFRAMTLAWHFYVDQLSKAAGERARQYLDQRGIDSEVARRFGLGLAPEGCDALASFMKSEKVTEDVHVAAGLAISREGGTAFTPAQLGLLKRYCDEAVLFFDADAAGRKAAERAEELLEPAGSSMAWAVNRTGAIESSGALRLRVALLPAGHDPDTFLRER